MTERSPERSGSAPRADVRAGLTGSASERKVVLQNLGAGPAHDVRLDLKPLAGRSSPLVDSEVASRLPLESLAPRDLVALTAVITTGTGLEFRARVRWVNDDGSEDESVQSLEV